MRTKIYSLLLLTVCLFLKAQTPELLYYKFEGTAANIPNLATSPPAGTQTAQIIGNFTLGSNTTCLGNGLIGSSSSTTANYLDTKWNIALSGSWTIHLKFSNYVNDTTTVYYLLGDSTSSGGSSFRMFTNGAPGANNIRLTGNGMTNVLITNVFPANNPVDLIIVYDNVAQNVKAYVNGVLNSTTAQANPLVFNGTLFKVGAYGGSGTGMKTGMIMDEFGLFNRAIADAEIASLNNFCSALSTDEMIKDNNPKIAVKAGSLILGKGSFGKYSIYDFAGREILTGNETSNIININTLQKGVYIIKYGENILVRFKY